MNIVRPDGTADAERHDDALLPARVPPTILWSYRLALVLLIAAYVTIVYIAVRAMQGTFGFSVLSVLFATGPVLVLGVFVLPLVPLTELPENWVLQQLPASRRKRGLCPACAYPMPDRSGRCPECGSDGRVRPLIEPSWSALRRFLQLALIAYALGVVVGEALVQIDEFRFRREVAALAANARESSPGVDGSSPIGRSSGASEQSTGLAGAFVGTSRPRLWPGSFATLRWTLDRGFEAEAPGLSTRHVP